MKFLKEIISSLRSPTDETSVAVESGLVRPSTMTTITSSATGKDGDHHAKTGNGTLPHSDKHKNGKNKKKGKHNNKNKNNQNGSEKSSDGDDASAFSCYNCVMDALTTCHQQANEDNDEDDSPIVIQNGNDCDVAFRQMFEALDRDSSGSIDIFELKKMIQGLGLPCTAVDLERMFSRIDRDGDGNISFEDFKADLLSRWITPSERHHLLVELFKMFDVTGDGNIQPKEVKVIMMSIGEKVSNQEIDEMFRQFNKGKDKDSIDVDDFVSAMESHIDSILPKTGDAAGQMTKLS